MVLHFALQSSVVLITSFGNQIHCEGKMDIGNISHHPLQKSVFPPPKLCNSFERSAHFFELAALLTRLLSVFVLGHG